MRAKMHPRATQERPRGGPEAPKMHQERPRGAQERPKDAQDTLRRFLDSSKIEPGELQDASWAHSLQQHLFEELREAMFDRLSCIVPKREP